MSKEYNFTNLVFEGGGIKAIAYLGALNVIEKKGILDKIQRVAGNSGGSIIVALLAVGFTPQEIKSIIEKTDFTKFKDDSYFPLFNIFRLINRYGWYKGKTFKIWLEDIISKKVDKNITFGQLKELNKMDLYIIGADVSSENEVIFSYENHKDMKIVDAVRISMSIPVFFRAIFRKSSVFVDGGIYYNYPLDLFDHKRYLSNNKKDNSKVYNKETLGFRVDTPDEIAEKRNRNKTAKKITSLMSYLKTLITSLIDLANKRHLSDKDWHRTVYIDSLGIETTQFNLTSEEKSNLIKSGEKGVLDYFTWFDNPKEKPINK